MVMRFSQSLYEVYLTRLQPRHVLFRQVRVRLCWPMDKFYRLENVFREQLLDLGFEPSLDVAIIGLADL
jgi:hypothetical protein